jgi:hypothetical protein
LYIKKAYTKMNFMDENKPSTSTCELCVIRGAITGINAATDSGKITREEATGKTNKIKGENCTFAQCESLRAKARNLLSPKRPLLAELLPEYWEE